MLNAAVAASIKKEELLDKAYQSVIDNWESIQEPDINLAALRKFLLDKIPFYSHALQMVDIVLVREEEKQLEQYKEQMGKPADQRKFPPMAYTNGFRVYICPKLYAVHGEINKKFNALVDPTGAVVTRPWFNSPALGIAFLILHEIGHIVFDSFGRLKHRGMGLWNLATDYQINQFVSRIMRESHIFKTDASFTAFLDVITKNFLHDPAKYEKMSAEEGYDDLYHARLDPQIHANGACFGDMDDSGKLSENDKMIKDIVDSELKDYVRKNSSKLPGKGTGFRELATLIEPPKVDLRQVLKQITDRIPREDWGYGNRQNRMDHLLPSKKMRLPNLIDLEPGLIRKVFFVLDSSGSMSDEQINDAINIVREVLNKHTKNPIHLIIHTDEVVHSAPLNDQAKWPKNFSGGTAFQPVLDHIAYLKEKEHIIPSCLIWTSDMYSELTEADYNARKFPFHKVLRWIVSGSDVIPRIGKYYHIDQI